MTILTGTKATHAMKDSETERMYGELFLSSFGRLRSVDCNKKIFRKILYRSFRNAERRCRKWKDYDM
jgi:hypothetical protein